MTEPLPDPRDPIAWLEALGMDVDLTAALLAAAWQMGAIAQLARVEDVLPLGVLIGQQLAGPPVLTVEALAVLFEHVRDEQAVPPSADVAEAMCHGGH